jgi:ribonuclease VapC
MNSLVVDTSALLSLYLAESTAGFVQQQFGRADRLLMSTINLGEALMVLRQRRPGDASLTQKLLAEPIDFIAVDSAHAVIAADARHRYPLNLGDCFAYALAKTRNLPLLTLDRDFRSTDIPVILPTAPSTAP